MEVNLNIGDLVSVNYCRVVAGALKLEAHTGIVTDYGGDERLGLPDSLHRSYKVLTVDGKHDWSPRSDLFLIQRVK
jgi:hypothetical protein